MNCLVAENLSIIKLMLIHLFKVTLEVPSSLSVIMFGRYNFPLVQAVNMNALSHSLRILGINAPHKSIINYNTIFSFRTSPENSKD